MGFCCVVFFFIDVHLV